MCVDVTLNPSVHPSIWFLACRGLDTTPALGIQRDPGQWGVLGLGISTGAHKAMWRSQRRCEVVGGSVFQG